MYYTNQAFRGAEVRYPRMDMLAFALVMIAWNLMPYFQAHLIKVLMKAPLKKDLKRLDASGCLTNWTIKLSELNIDYLLRNVVKGQVLADFIVEFTNLPEEILVAPTGKP